MWTIGCRTKVQLDKSTTLTKYPNPNPNTYPNPNPNSSPNSNPNPNPFIRVALLSGCTFLVEFHICPVSQQNCGRSIRLPNHIAHYQELN